VRVKLRYTNEITTLRFSRALILALIIIRLYYNHICYNHKRINIVSQLLFRRNYMMVKSASKRFECCIHHVCIHMYVIERLINVLLQTKKSRFYKKSSFLHDDMKNNEVIS